MLKIFAKKYVLTNTTINHEGRRLYQVKAVRDIPKYNVKTGDLGGFVQGYRNLSQSGDCWVGENGKVYDHAKVCDDAVVRHKAVVYDHARVCGRAVVYGYASVYGDSRVADDSEVYGDSLAFELARVGGKSHIHGYAELSGNCKVIDSAIHGDTTIFGRAKVKNSEIFGNSTICSKQIVNNEKLKHKIMLINWIKMLVSLIFSIKNKVLGNIKYKFLTIFGFLILLKIHKSSTDVEKK